ncbi:MAG TPA: S8/S53 family peptidase, partial [Dongiaceae bacterium]
QQLRQHLGWPAGQALQDLPRATPPRGFRLIIETERGIGIDALRQHLQQVYGEVSLQRGFPQYEPDIDLPSLQDYYIATLPHLDADHLLINPFDIAYASLQKGLVKGAEPDLASVPANHRCIDNHAQFHLDHRWSLKVMNVPAAWDKLAALAKNRGGGIRIGQPDTGVTFHERSFGKFDLAAGFDFYAGNPGPIDPLTARRAITLGGDVPGHGTMTSSIIIASDPDPAQQKMIGIAPDATVVPCRVTQSVAIRPGSELAQGFDHAWQNSCRIVSVSLGGVTGHFTHAAVRNCYSRGLLICCAAGQCERIMLFPALYHETIGCGGTRLRDQGGEQVESYWSPGAIGPISIAAPAEKVWVCIPDTNNHDRQLGIIHAGTPNDPFNALSVEEGTSFSTAAVAAIGALWLKFHEDKDLLGMYHRRRPLNDVFKQVLHDTARKPQGWRLTSWGPGIIDAAAVLDAPLPSPGPAMPDADYLALWDQGDDLDVWCRIFWDLPRDAVIRVLGRLLQAVDLADLRQHLHQLGYELTWLIHQGADQALALRHAIQAEATSATDQVADAAASLAERASDKLRSMLT